MEQLMKSISYGLTKLYNKNKDENYRRALKDVSFDICKYLETNGVPLNKTDLTMEWMESEERKEYRRLGLIK